MVKQIIKEAMDQNPLGLKEAVAEELRTRVALALEKTMNEDYWVLYVDGKKWKSYRTDAFAKADAKEARRAGKQAKIVKVKGDFKESVDLEEAFKIGDRVKIKPDASKSTLDGHKSVLRKSGKVVKDYGDGDFKVNFGGNDDRSVSGSDLVKESVDLEEAAKWQLNPDTYMVGGDLSYDDKLEYTLKKADSDILNRFLAKASDSEKTKLWNMFWRSKERGNSVPQGPVNAINYAKKALKESVDLEEAITAENKKDAEAVVAYAKENRGKGIATKTGDNRIIPNIQIVRYLESIGKVKNVKELPSGKGWSFELNETAELSEISNKTKQSYLKKAIKSKALADHGVERAKERLSGPPDSGTEFDKRVLVTRQRTSQNRAAGIARASMKKESVDLEEAKMTDAEVLSAAKALAANGKDAETKAFGKGLVDFYKKEGSFTPAQVGGLQNIMKNASFQLAKESADLSEVDMGQARSVQDRRDSTKSGSANKYHVVNKNGNVVSSHDNQGDAMRAAMKNDDYRVKKVS